MLTEVYRGKSVWLEKFLPKDVYKTSLDFDPYTSRNLFIFDAAPHTEIGMSTITQNGLP